MKSIKMFCKIVFAVALLTAPATAQDITPTPVPNIWQPAPGTTWQWQLSGEIDTSYDVQMYDIDLFDTSTDTIDGLHADGRVVICYFSAGTYEDWRPDADGFPESILGKPLEDWEGERYLDIRQQDQLQPIMLARLDFAVEKGCDGVEPDNVEIYDNDTGFDITLEDQQSYNLWMSEMAHERGLSIGLKNGSEQVLELVDYFDWALVEECFQYEFCEDFLPFIEQDKAVFGVEYVEGGLDRSEYCPAANEMGFSWLTKELELDDLPPNTCLGFDEAP